MDTDGLIAVMLVVGALVVLLLLVMWSRRIIERIAREHLGSLRDFLREQKNGR